MLRFQRCLLGLMVLGVASAPNIGGGAKKRGAQYAILIAVSKSAYPESRPSPDSASEMRESREALLETGFADDPRQRCLSAHDGAGRGQRFEQK